MGSWTNLTGMVLQACINNRCGQKPVAPLVMTPASTQEWANKTVAYNQCVAECTNKDLSGLRSVQTTISGAEEKTTTLDKGEPVPAIGYEPKPLGIGTAPAENKLKTSNLILVGVLIAAGLGVWYMTKKKG